MTRKERRNFVYKTIIEFISLYKEKNINDFFNCDIDIVILKKFDGVIMKYKQNDKEIGDCLFVYEHTAEPTALFGISNAAFIYGGYINDILLELNFSFIPEFYRNLKRRFFAGSLGEKFPKDFGSYGTMSFFTVDTEKDIYERTRKFFIQTEDWYLSCVKNMLLKKKDLIHNIFTRSEYFVYPLATGMIVACLHNDMKMIKEINEIRLKRKFYDGGNKRFAEVCSKIGKKFNINIEKYI